MTASIGAGSITAQGCNGNAAFSGGYTVAGCPPQDHYNIAQIGGSIVPGTTDIGNHGDDQITTIALPFPYTLYGTTFTSVNLSSNGNAQFTTTDTMFFNQCPPWTNPRLHHLPVLGRPGIGRQRVWHIHLGKWHCSQPHLQHRVACAVLTREVGTANFELRLYEGQSRFDIIYGTVTNGNTSATAGVQKNDTTFDQYFCNGSGGAATGGQSYILQSCTSPTPTATPTATLRLRLQLLQRQRPEQRQQPRLQLPLRQRLLRLVQHLRRRLTATATVGSDSYTDSQRPLRLRHLLQLPRRHQPLLRHPARRLRLRAHKAQPM